MTEGPIRLEVRNLHWLPSLEPRQDFCAHGDVVLEIGGAPVPYDETDALCVSAAAMNLLRTLERDHTQEAPVSEHLFPHCGHVWVQTEEHGLVNIAECSAGLDVEVRHRGGHVVIATRVGKEAAVSEAEWTRAVCAFADRVEELSRRSDPKDLSLDEDGWYEPFWEEWRTRRARAASA
jgi:hypothetical protein